MRNAGRRRANDSLASERRPPPPTPSSAAGTPGDPWHFLSTGRDSDASFASTRPSSSSVGINPRSSMVPITDKSYQVSAIRTINAYLSSHSFPTILKPPLPPAKDIIETLKFILSRLGFTASKIEDDLQIVLKTLNSPVKLNKSALRAPGTPHSWPSLLAVIHWLVQVNLHDDHLLSVKQTRSNFEHNDMFQYSCKSYLFYIRGDDDSVEALDDENMKTLISAKEGIAEVLNNLEETVRDSEKKLEGIKTGPSERERLEKEKILLEEDVKKFHAMIEQLDGHMVSVEKVLLDKEKELETKILESNKVKEENEELKRRIEEQGINAYDAERMRKELIAVERDIAETEDARNEWEEKTWNQDSQIGHKLQELEGQIIECNQAMRRLKLGNEYQYHLDPKGSTAIEVFSLDYKSTLKPALASFEDNIKKGSMDKLEEVISLRRQSAENETKIDAKRNKTAALNTHIEEVEVHLNMVKKESQDFTAQCASETRKMLDEVETEAQNLEIVEKEATEMLKASNLKLQEVIKQTDEEIQLCARKLFMLIDSVSKSKEYMKSEIADMKKDLQDTTGAIANVHRGSFSVTLGHAFESSH